MNTDHSADSDDDQEPTELHSQQQGQRQPRDSASQTVQKLAVCHFLRIILYVTSKDSTYSPSATSVAFAKLAAIVMTRAQDVFAWAAGACTRHNLEFAINGLESQ